MPKKTSQKNHTVVESGRIYCAVTSVSNVASIILNPDSAAGYLGNFGTKLASLSNCFQLFRFTKLLFEFSAAPISTSDGFVGYAPEIGVAPTSSTEISEMPFSMPRIEQSQTCVIRRSVPKRVLMGTGVRWFRTRVSASYDDNLEFQGFIAQYTSNATAVIRVIVEYTIELKDFVGTNQTPKTIKEARVESDSDFGDDPSESASGKSRCHLGFALCVAPCNHFLEPPSRV